MNESMFDAQPPEKEELMNSLLKPLLEDFQYWFGRSRTLLEQEQLDFLEDGTQDNLLKRLKHAQQEVNTSSLLLQATEGQVGVEMSVLMEWHRLVAECWQIAMRHRMKTG
ncbi:MAG: DUF2605 domain-containing protein [Cyanobacteria bacterium J06638_22]